ncbi:glycine-rich RNA-binding protein RZ1C-like isoform X2 [Phoenix dactylifera]|uniref:Glycine-rich RNA-binding protein RZ1C-like isoform X2 n=1 Tax=Phoenix dactylifera TaxID=42345 RepID=A0A8B8J773_PHODC|nr:glycine-rich RNA-binding protein RZ1C-like isoform X2 [Phoenix dactylifera]
MSYQLEMSKCILGTWDSLECALWRHQKYIIYLFFIIQVMLERDTGRPRGFGFVTFAEPRAVEDSIREMHNQELDGRVISVNKAQPKMSSDDTGYGYGGGGYSSGGRGGYRGGGGDAPPPVGHGDCFKCGRPGHWARECPSAGGGGGRFSSRSRFGGSGGGGGHGERFGGPDRYHDRYMDDRYDGGRYGDRDRLDKDSRYSGVRDRYANDRYPPGDRIYGDRYAVGTDRYPQNGYGKERGYDKDGPRGSSGYDRYGQRGGGGDRYGGGGPARNEGGGSYRDRPGPYDRPSRSGRPSSYDDRY